MYDEVDRRETDAAWLASMSPHEVSLVNERYIVPFLPVNPEFSATRNQSRQKLAKFNAREFASLIIDVLSEGKRRYLTAIGEIAPGDRNGGDESLTPDYDSVPAEESSSPIVGERVSLDSPFVTEAGREKSREVSATRSSTKSGNSDSEKGRGSLSDPPQQ